MKEKQKLTQVSVDKILQEITELCTIHISKLGESVKYVVERTGLLTTDIPGLL